MSLHHRHVRGAATLLTVAILGTFTVVLPQSAQAAASITALARQTVTSGAGASTSTSVAIPATGTWEVPGFTSGGLSLGPVGGTASVHLHPAQGAFLSIGTVPILSSFGTSMPTLTTGLMGCSSFSGGQLTLTDVAYSGTTLTRLSGSATGSCTSSTKVTVLMRYQATDEIPVIKGQMTFPVTPATINETQQATATYTNVGMVPVAFDDVAQTLTLLHATAGPITNSCRGTTLPVGSTCTVTLDLTPTTLGQPGLAATIDLPASVLTGGMTTAAMNQFVLAPPVTPGAPAITSVAAADDGIDVQWNESGSAVTGFQVSRRIGSGADEQIAAPSSPVRRLQDFADIPAASSVHYRVRSVNRGVIGPWSAETTVTARAKTSPANGPNTALVVDVLDSAAVGATVLTHRRSVGSDVVNDGTTVGAIGLIGLDERGLAVTQLSMESAAGLQAGTFDLGATVGPTTWRLMFDGNCVVTGTVNVSAVNQSATGTLRELSLELRGSLCDGTYLRAQALIKSADPFSSTKLSASPATLKDVPLDGPAIQTVVTVANDGLVATSAGTATIEDAAANEWSIASDGCQAMSLAPAATCQVTLTYDPTAPRSASVGTLTVPLGDFDRTLKVEGNSIEPPGALASFTVKTSKGIAELAWTEGDTGGVDPAHVRLYRGTSPTSLALIQDTTAMTRFVDRGLVPGTTYYYAAEASNDAGAGPRTDPITAVSTSDALFALRQRPTDDVVRLLTVPMTAGVADWTNAIQLSGSNVDVLDVATSPDGQWIAVSQTAAAFYGVTVMRIDGSEARAVASGGGDWRDPAWSADGKKLATTRYTSPSDTTGDVYTIDAFVNAAVPLMKATNASSPSWTSDSASLVITNDTLTPSLARVTLSSGARTAISGSTSMYGGAVSPDGATVAASRIEPAVSGQPVHRLVTLPIGGGTATTLTPVPALGRIDNEPAWSLDGSVVWFATTTYGPSGPSTSTLARVARAGGAYTPMFSALADYYSPALSQRDTIAPSAWLSIAPSPLLGTSVAVSWNGRDVGSGVASYDVNYRSISYSGRSTTRTLYSATTRTSGTVAIAPGNEYCVSVRARDAAGNAGPWSPQRCSSIPLDNVSLARSSGWSTSSSAGYFKLSAAVSARKGASLTRTGAQFKRIALVVRTCPTCGQVSVYIGNSRITTVSTRAAKGQYKKVLWLPATTSARSGTLKLVVVGNGPVYVDGVTFFRG